MREEPSQPPFGYSGIDGVYKGFTPSDESALTCGEFHVVIEPNWILILIATGLEVQTAATKRCDWRDLTTDEVLDMFNPGADVADVTGLTYGESGISLLFLKEQPETPNVLVAGIVNLRADYSSTEGVPLKRVFQSN